METRQQSGPIGDPNWWKPTYKYVHKRLYQHKTSEDKDLPQSTVYKVNQSEGLIQSLERKFFPLIGITPCVLVGSHAN